MQVDSGTERAEGMEEVGPALRRIRVSQGLSLTGVAELAGITKGFLSLVERGRTRVSVPVLLRICEVLGVSIGSLFSYPSDEVLHGGTPLYMGGNDLQEYLLTPSSEPFIQVMRTRMQSGGGSDGAYTLNAETIFVIVLEGRLHLEVDGKVMLLDKGDATTFSARKPHNWSNPLSTDSEVLWVIAPPLPRQ
jgi:transcriptional regulator with XRE-family HTH domain